MKHHKASDSPYGGTNRIRLKGMISADNRHPCNIYFFGNDHVHAEHHRQLLYYHIFLLCQVEFSKK